MTIAEKVATFSKLHVPATPLRLVNVWDAGSTRAVTEAGAAAVATSSWAVAAAVGYPDGEQLPFDALIATAEAVLSVTDLPVSVDFEGGYADAPEQVSIHAQTLLRHDVVGCNFEDRIVKGQGLFAIEDQAARLRAVVDAAFALGRPVFVNARTDLFLGSDPAAHAGFVDEALDRAHAYAAAGAGSFFVPGLGDPALIERICRESPLPVNIMVLDTATDLGVLAALGVARISFGPAPYVSAMQSLTVLAGQLLGK